MRKIIITTPRVMDPDHLVVTGMYYINSPRKIIEVFGGYVDQRQGIWAARGF